MTIENNKEVTRFRIQRFLVTIIIMLVIAVLLVSNLVRQPVYGLTKLNIIAIIFGIFIFYSLFNYLKNRHFFYFSDDGKKLVFRYFSLRTFEKGKHAVEIPKESFGGYETYQKMGGLNEFLILKLRTRKGLASYPPILISYLSKDKKSRLFKVLNRSMGR